MKIIKFRGSLTGSSYAYVKCWPWERIAINHKIKMATRATGLIAVTWEPGPKAWGCSFIIATHYRKRRPS